ncbi:hypothetical protein E4U54_000413, partial [Claviceps lovelessii]
LPPSRCLQSLHLLPQSRRMRPGLPGPQCAPQPRARGGGHPRARRLGDHQGREPPARAGQEAHRPGGHPVRQRGRHVGGGAGDASRRGLCQGHGPQRQGRLQHGPPLCALVGKGRRRLCLLLLLHDHRPQPRHHHRQRCRPQHRLPRPASHLRLRRQQGRRHPSRPQPGPGARSTPHHRQFHLSRLLPQQDDQRAAGHGGRGGRVWQDEPHGQAGQARGHCRRGRLPRQSGRVARQRGGSRHRWGCHVGEGGGHFQVM